MKCRDLTPPKPSFMVLKEWLLLCMFPKVSSCVRLRGSHWLGASTGEPAILRVVKAYVSKQDLFGACSV